MKYLAKKIEAEVDKDHIISVLKMSFILDKGTPFENVKKENGVWKFTVLIQNNFVNVESKERPIDDLEWADPH